MAFFGRGRDRPWGSHAGAIPPRAIAGRSTRYVPSDSLGGACSETSGPSPPPSSPSRSRSSRPGTSCSTSATSARGWAGFIWLAPVLGAASYLVLGVNRIRRRAQALRLPEVRARIPEELRPPPPPLPPEAEHLRSLVSLADAAVRRPLVAGNAVTPLEGGARAYGEMRAAIDRAERSVTLCTYIFDPGVAGDAIAAALAGAHERGAKVRVLIDAVGARYRFPPAHRRLRKLGLTAELFLPRLTPGWLPFVNLRNHRKVLVVDGKVGLTGGMNIRDDFLPAGRRAPFMDLHARVEGPVVQHLQAAFAEDWLFTTGESLDGPAFFPPLQRAGDVLAR